MVGRDPREVGGGGGVTDPAEELPDLPLPPAKVLAQERLLLVVRDFDCPERFAPPPEQQLALTGCTKVTHPVRVPARRDQVAMPVDREEVDGGPPGRSAPAPGHFQHARPGDA